MMVPASPLQRSLKTLLNQRFSLLSRRLKPSTRHSSSYQNIISEALLSEIRKEILSILEKSFSEGIKPAPDGNPEDPDSAPVCQCRCCTQGQQGPCSTPPWYPANSGCFGTAQMEITLDQMVAETLMHGRQTSGVLRALFGLVPLLIGR